MKQVGTMVDTRAARAGATLAGVGAAVFLLCAASVLYAGYGYRQGTLTLASGLMSIRWGATGAAFGALAALVGVIMLAPLRRRGPWLLAVAALVLNLFVAVPPLLLSIRAQTLPRIHDVTTDTIDPPAFVAVVPLRQGARNTLDYPAQTAAQQRRGYPDIRPLRVAAEPARAMARAEQVARDMGWEIVAIAPQDGRLEATATSVLFGFKDDIVVRVRPDGADATVIDVRSISRIGGFDFGANARRVRAFLARLTG